MDSVTGPRCCIVVPTIPLLLSSSLNLRLACLKLLPHMRVVLNLVYGYLRQNIFLKRFRIRLVRMDSVTGLRCCIVLPTIPLPTTKL